MTLIEVMVAMLIAMVGLLGGLAMISSMLGGTSFSRHQSEAAVLAQSRLEELQSLTGVTLTSPADTSGAFVQEATTLDSTGKTNSNPSFGIYTRLVRWSTDGQAWGNRRLIEVKVSWQDGLGIAHDVTVNGVRIQNQ
jgi:type II secretory pathway pseudopilin PulG